MKLAPRYTRNFCGTTKQASSLLMVISFCRADSMPIWPSCIFTEMDLITSRLKDFHIFSLFVFEKREATHRNDALLTKSCYLRRRVVLVMRRRAIHWKIRRFIIPVPLIFARNFVLDSYRQFVYFCGIMAKSVWLFWLLHPASRGQIRG